MKTEEKQLFKNLCNLKAEHFDAELLKFATPAVLGHLFFNRMQVIAYGVLRDQGLLGKVNREFRNSLRSAYEQNVEKNNSFYWCVQYLDDVLSKCNCKYAMLKGAYLCHYYRNFIIARNPAFANTKRKMFAERLRLKVKRSDFYL